MLSCHLQRMLFLLLPSPVCQLFLKNEQQFSVEFSISAYRNIIKVCEIFSYTTVGVRHIYWKIFSLRIRYTQSGISESVNVL